MNTRDFELPVSWGGATRGGTIFADRVDFSIFPLPRETYVELGRILMSKHGEVTSNGKRTWKRFKDRY